MKKTFQILALAVVAALAACGGGANKNNAENKDSLKVNPTIENLKTALNGETTASAKYAAYAVKAKEEKLTQIAAMFMAASRSEAIHAANHQKVLTEMGVTQDAKTDTFTVKTTLENLETALKGETYEVDNMYPGFVQQAKTDQADKASKSFNWAADSEKKHMAYYSAAIGALKTKKTGGLPVEYYVCPKCGYTYNNEDVAESCELCGTGKDKYEVFK